VLVHLNAGGRISNAAGIQRELVEIGYASRSVHHEISVNRDGAISRVGGDTITASDPLNGTDLGIDPHIDTERAGPGDETIHKTWIELDKGSRVPMEDGDVRVRTGRHVCELE
jgi:hypothetical protein